MKKGKDDEKGMGPMFPRLHVNDTEKGGPRAPPRNKMALYEQLTIPSQRYNSGAVPPNHSNSSNLVPSTSTIQGTRHEKNMHFPVYRPPLAMSYDDHQARHPEGVSSSNQPEPVNSQRKPPEEDDFMVPIFSQARIGLCDGKIQNNIDVERQVHPSSNTSTREKDGGRWREEALDKQLGNSHQDISLSLNHSPPVGFEYRYSNDADIGAQKVINGRSVDKTNVERGDDVSETSMVDCASGLDITPDDVLGVLGRKHFWKARTAIVNQQRVFAVQVFELHRLIKVQKLIAGSPHLLLEASALVDKASLNKRTAMKQYSSDYTVKAIAHNSIKHKDDSQKLTDKLEGTAENAVVRAPIPPPHQPFPVVSPGPSPAVNTTDPKMNLWGSFPQPTGHQWLVPVMSPSEGLIYKPYPGPGFAGGGCGPPIPMPYGAPAPHPHHQAAGGMPFGGQGYFFPYGMQMASPAGSASAVEQTNPFTGPNPYGQTNHLGNPTIQQQASCNMPTQRSAILTPSAFRAPPPKEVERQGSSASSPCDRAQAPQPKEREIDALPLFPIAPTSETPELAPPTENPSTRVIRVVPRNPVSSRESAARIFQSIQEERKRHES